MTPEEIEELKKKHGEVFEVTLRKKGEKNEKIYLRKPTIDDLKNGMMAMQSPSDNIGMGQSIFQNVFLGDIKKRLEIVNDTGYMTALLPILNEITTSAEATLKKV